MISGGKQVPVILQAETNECGLACLGMILSAHGRHVTLTALRELFPDNRVLSLEEMTIAAAQHDLNARAVRCEIGDLSNIRVPAVLHFDFDHYVVLVSAGKARYTIIDPAHGRLDLSITHLGERFTGIALELTPSDSFKTLGSKPSYSPLSILRRLPLSSLKRPLSIALLLSICIQGFALLSPLYLQIMVDEVIVSGRVDFGTVVLLGFSGIYMISLTCRWLRGFLLIQIGQHLSYYLAAGLLSKLLNLPNSYFSRRTIGDVVSRFSSIKPLQEFVTTSAITVLLDLLMLTSTWIMLASYSLPAALYVIFTVGMAAVINFVLMLSYRSHIHQQIIAEADSQSHFIETVQSMDAIHRYQVEPRRSSEWLNRLTRVINAQISAAHCQLYAELSRYLLSGAILLGVVYISLDDVLSAGLTIGMLYAMVSYTNHFSQAVMSLLVEWQRFLMLYLHVQRLSDITDQSDKVSEPVRTYGNNTLVLRQVSFGFEQSGSLLLDKISLTLKPGQSLAVVGPSGCGKTSLFRLLFGELTPLQGEITLGGRPLSRAVCPHEIFSSLTAGDQLMAGSILQNITFNDPKPDMQRVLAAAQAAEIHEDILRLPLAYKEQVNGPVSTLSAGQRQRILIARALYRNAEILLLDEGTSHLDAQTELRVMRNILSREQSCIFVTHNDRLAALADQRLDLAKKPEPLQALPA